MFLRKLTLGVVVLSIIVAAAYWASLLHSLNGLEAGFRDRDIVKLEKYVDWARIREQIRSEIKSATTAHLVQEATRGDGGGAALFGTLIAGAIAPAMIDQLVNDLVTARSLARILSDQNSVSKGQFSVVRLGLTDIDEYTLAARFRDIDPDHELRLILRRDGVTWRLTTIDFGSTDLLWKKLAHRFEPPGAGLEVTVRPIRTADALVINGDIVNSAEVTRRVPRLRVSLRDGNKTELDARIIDPPVASLAPGATARFDTTFEHPSITATGVAVPFASR